MFGHEHYAEDFEDLACAATPIHGPISGKMVGAVDLTRWRKDADALLIAFAKTTADQITQALPAAGSAPEVEPLQEYLRACRHSSGIVLARNSDMVMMNDYARQVLDVMPERGSSTVLGKNRSNPAGSPPGPAWLRPTATAACARPGPPAARPAAHAAAGY